MFQSSKSPVAVMTLVVRTCSNLVLSSPWTHLTNQSFVEVWSSKEHIPTEEFIPFRPCRELLTLRGSSKRPQESTYTALLSQKISQKPLLQKHKVIFTQHPLYSFPFLFLFVLSSALTLSQDGCSCCSLSALFDILDWVAHFKLSPYCFWVFHQPAMTYGQFVSNEMLSSLRIRTNNW